METLEKMFISRKKCYKEMEMLQKDLIQDTSRKLDLSNDIL